MSELKLEMAHWRFEIFEDYSRELISGLDDETKEKIGSDRAREIEALLYLLEGGPHFPPEAKLYPNLLHDESDEF